MKTIQERFAALWMKIPRRYPELAKLAGAYHARWSKAPEILFLGDSVLERISRDDTDTRPVDQMVAEHLYAEKRLLCISRPAYHLKVYYHLLKTLEVAHQKPELVILPINMRSFSPQWALNPAWQFDEEVELLKKFIETRKISALRSNASALVLSEAERMTVLDLPFTDMDRIGQFVDLINSAPLTVEQKLYRKKQIYIFHYLQALTLENPRLMYLGKILDLLRELKVNALVYVTPVNYQGGERHVGDGFVEAIRANAAVVRTFLSRYLEGGEVRFLDLEEFLTSEFFFNADEAAEHLNQYGRAKLARWLVDEIRGGWGVSS